MASRAKSGDYRVAYEANKAIQDRAEKEFSESVGKINESMKERKEYHPESRDTEDEQSVQSHAIPLTEAKEKL